MKFLEPFLPKLYLVIIPSSQGFFLSGELRKKTKCVKRFESQYIADVESLEKQIKVFEKEGAIAYVVLLEIEARQGTISDCHHLEDLDASSIEKVCVANTWGIYIDKDDLFDTQRRYKEVGLDLLYSPFSLLNYLHKEAITKEDGLYLLLLEDKLFSAVFKEGKLLFSESTQLKPDPLADDAARLQRYVQSIQTSIKYFYDAKIDEAMFIEKLFVADALALEIDFENRLEEELFVSVHREDVDVAETLVAMSEAVGVSQSFVETRKKSVLTPELIWLLGVFSFLVLVMISSTFLLDHAITTNTTHLKNLQTNASAIAAKHEKVTAEIKRLEALEKLRERITTANHLKKENVKNFFDLVPDGVTLTLAQLRGNTLRLEGVVASKRHFNATFQRSLDSLFSRSSTKFTKRKDGRYDFKNISIMEEK